MFQAVAALVESIAGEAPLLLVVDDLQWAEPSTLLLLAHLVGRGVAGTAVLATVRSTAGGTPPTQLLGDLGTARTIDVLELEGLDVGEVGEFSACAPGSLPPTMSPNSCVGTLAATRSFWPLCWRISTRRRRCVRPTGSG